MAVICRPRLQRRSQKPARCLGIALGLLALAWPAVLRRNYGPEPVLSVLRSSQDRIGCRPITLWSQQLLQTFPDAVSGVLLGVSAPICDPRDKRALHVSSGAIAVDMESHVVAAVGAAHGLPVAAMRVVTDPAERTLPASAVAAMRPNGTTNIGAMIKAVLMRPREIPALFQTALDALAARATLVRGRRLLGPALLLVNSLQSEPVTATNPTWDLQYKQQPWKVPNGAKVLRPQYTR